MKRIVFFGDSLTAGTYGVGYVGELDGHLDVGRCERVNAGIAGNTTWNLLERLDRAVLDREPDLVVLQGGHNDFLTVNSWITRRLRGLGRTQKILPITPEVFRTNHHVVLDRLQARLGDRVICTSTTILGELPDSPMNRAFRPYVEIVREAAEKRGLPFVDFHQAFGEACRRAGGVRDYTFGPFLVSTVLVRFLRRDPETVARLLGLKLTFDTRHPNRTGSQLLARTLAPTLRPYL